MSPSTASQTPTLSSFLSHARQTLKDASSNSTSPITLVIGNQSADLDSFTSATLYAYFRTQDPSPSKLTPTYIPILNIPAEDVDIRPEFHALFRHANIDPTTLNTLDDLGPIDTLESRLPPARTNFVLTDHNKLEGDLGAIYGASSVRGVIDHHEDEHAVPQDTHPEPRIVKVCGSCTALVVQHIAPVWDSLVSNSNSDSSPNASSPAPKLHPEESARIAKFALASVLIDTRNLQSKDKTTSADESVASYLQQKIAQASGSSFPTTDFFTEIKAAKNDISGLNAQGVFRKDYKAWTENGLTIGTSSAVKRLPKLAKKVAKEHDKKAPNDADAWGSAAVEFMKTKNADLWLVLTSFNDDEGVHRRELALHWGRGDLGWVAAEFEAMFGDELQLERSVIEGMWSEEGDQGGRRTWLQRNGAWSRKQVAPAIRRVMREKAPEVRANV